MIVIGALVGGIVGVLVSKNHNAGHSAVTTTTALATFSSSPTSTSSLSSTSGTTSTSTSSIYTVLPSTINNVLPLNCPGINNTQFTTDEQSFVIYCLMDFKTSTKNIAQSLEPSITGCIESCATYNTNNSNTICQGLTFGANLTEFGGANCFLKSGLLSKFPYQGDNQAGAVLIG